MKCVILVVSILFVLYVYSDAACWGATGNGEYFLFIPVWRYKNGIFWRKGLLCSLSRVTVHVTLWWILTKICILVEEVQLQLKQGKIFMVAAFTLHLFLPGKNERKQISYEHLLRECWHLFYSELLGQFTQF